MVTLDELEFVKAADSLENPYIEQWKKEKKKVLGYYCSYAPEELIYALDLLPFRIRGTTCADTVLADAILSRFNCSFVKATLNLALEEKYNFLDGLVTTNSCDHVRRMIDVWKMKEVRAKEGMSVLEAARRVDIRIPTLCYHEKLKPYGACRICTVEIETHGMASLVAACIYPVQENSTVITKSEKIIKIRKTILELMLAYAPESKILQDLSQEYEVKEVRFKEKPSFCILCGLCVRYCAEIERKNAVDFIGRGKNREVMFIPQIASEECPSCKRCFPLCPTEAVQANFVLTQALFLPSPSAQYSLEE